jgi:hypothetical protein
MIFQKPLDSTGPVWYPSLVAEEFTTAMDLNWAGKTGHDTKERVIMGACNQCVVYKLRYEGFTEEKLAKEWPDCQYEGGSPLSERELAEWGKGHFACHPLTGEDVHFVLAGGIFRYRDNRWRAWIDRPGPTPGPRAQGCLEEHS